MFNWTFILMASVDCKSISNNWFYLLSSKSFPFKFTLLWLEFFNTGIKIWAVILTVTWIKHIYIIYWCKLKAQQAAIYQCNYIIKSESYIVVGCSLHQACHYSTFIEHWGPPWWQWYNWYNCNCTQWQC